MKGLINIKNDDNKCFFGVMWYLNPLNQKHQKILKVDKTMAYNIDYKGIRFPVSKKDYKRIEKNIYLH